MVAEVVLGVVGQQVLQVEHWHLHMVGRIYSTNTTLNGHLTQTQPLSGHLTQTQPLSGHLFCLDLEQMSLVSLTQWDSLPVSVYVCRVENDVAPQ